LKSNHATQGVPVLVITGHPGELSRRMAESNGCNGYLVKPCMPAVLLQEVKRLIG
jgi:CheY-like chemotaxis protein